MSDVSESAVHELRPRFVEDYLLDVRAIQHPDFGLSSDFFAGHGRREEQFRDVFWESIIPNRARIPVAAGERVKLKPEERQP